MFPPGYRPEKNYCPGTQDSLSLMFTAELKTSEKPKCPSAGE